MKKKLLSLLLCISVIMSPIYGVAGSESRSKVPIDNFRDIEWRTSLKEVEDSVITKDMVEEKDYSFYENSNGDYNLYIPDGSVSNYKASVTYTFQNDLFVEGMYFLKEKHTDNNAYYDDYCKLVDIYTEKYGDPYSSDEEWSNDLYKGKKEYIGLAIAMGYVYIDSFWIDDDGNTLMIYIDGDNYEITTSISYMAEAYTFSSNTDGV